MAQQQGNSGGSGPERHAKHRLKLKGALGKGAFGEIFKGLCDGEVVAVKTVARGTSQPPGAPSSLEEEQNAHTFFREAEMLRACDHTRIIGYKALMKMPSTDKVSKEPMWALVMEFATHGNLGQRVVQNMIHPSRTSYSTAQALRWALDVASALEYLHMRSPAVLHRDVKSANIMLTDEGGSIVAKLSDFGLHVTADGSKPRTLQASSFYNSIFAKRSSSSGGGGGGNGGAGGLPAVTVTAGTPTHSSATTKSPDSSSHTHSSSCGPIQPQQQQQQQQQQQVLQAGDRSSSTAAAAAAATAAAQAAAAALAAAAAEAQEEQHHELHTEVHDSSGGSKVFMGSHSATGGSAAAAAAAAAAPNTQQQQQQQGAEAPASTPSAAAAAAGGPGQRQPAKRTSSFRRAAHHPPGEALPRLPPGSGGSITAAAAAAGPGGVMGDQLECVADANARLFAHWRAGASSTEGSMGSMVTEGTWATQGTAGSCTDTAGIDCTDDTCGSIFEEVETVFNMTGRTGSCLYMAPEVYLAHSYNEKSDVFSYGVVLYELFARCLVVFTELPTNTTDMEAPQRYAAKVASGYRPARPKSMPDNIWTLITACWQQDPLLRPHMSEVVAVLTAALQDKISNQLNRRKGRPSPGFMRPKPLLNPTAAASSGPSATTAAAAAAAGDVKAAGSSGGGVAGGSSSGSGRRSLDGRRESRLADQGTTAAATAAAASSSSGGGTGSLLASRAPSGAGKEESDAHADARHPQASQGCACVIC